MIPRWSFATLGAPERSLTACVGLARSWGSGLEIRSALDGHVSVEMSPSERRAARATLRGVSALALSTYVRVADTTFTDDEIIDALTRERRLAFDLGIEDVRVFPGAQAPRSDATALLIRRLRMTLDRGPRLGGIVVETHDSHSTVRSLAPMLEALPEERVRIAWDSAHTRTAGEEYEESLRLGRDRFAYVQVKDEELPERHPALPGKGDLDLAALFAACRHAGYGGPFSLEWERRWHPDLPPIEAAIDALHDVPGADAPRRS